MPDIVTLDYDMAAHLLLRAGFGHNGRYDRDTGEATEVRDLADLASALGPAGAIDDLMDFNVSRAKGPGNLKGLVDGDFPKLERWWINRMLKKKKGLREKMVLFLHTHFATSGDKVGYSRHMAVQNALFREFAVGDFRELVKRITVDAAMLIWLDVKLNEAAAPNENYARELQELFTLGVYDFAGERNYAQKDVVRAARALSGWTEETSNKIIVEFDIDRHDTGSKVIYAPVLGETPNQDPANEFTIPANYSPPEEEYQFLVDKIFDHVDTEGRPTAARFITRRMWKFFAYEPEVDVGTPRADLTLIDELADVFKNSGYNLGALLRAMFLRTEFYADTTRTIKSPAEYLVGSLRMLRGKLSGEQKNDVGSDTLARMGQELFFPPDVFSWRGNEAWITTQTFLERYEFARNLAATNKGSEIGHDVYDYIDVDENTRQQVVNRFLKLLGPLSVNPATNTTLLSWLGPADPIDLTDDEFVDVKVRGLVNLILTLPHYNTH